MQTLLPGTYFTGLTFFDSTPLAQFGTAFTTIPEVTYLNATVSNAGPNSGLVVPDSPFNTDGVFGSTLRVAQVSVPEPASVLSLLTLGTLGAVSTLKRQLKK
ncbi:PEP-CTERM sorting domain-containing protein [Coleofasciculus chthonoplastes]|uniref:PEP-CTERM sorting domain-containing protein n=1 Tax=Coleofasciculus chthonoplastes TaxID=64178 RepID=UPI0032F90A59